MRGSSHSKRWAVAAAVMLCVACVSSEPVLPAADGRDAGGDVDAVVDAGGEDQSSSDLGANDADMPDADTAAFPGVGTVFATRPVEVLGPPGATATVAFELTNAGSDVTATLQLFNVVDHDMARLWVNGSGSLELSDPGSPFVVRTGGTATGDVVIPATWLVPGTNTLTFEYTRQVPDVSGYRVLALTMMRNLQTVFELDAWDDPENWASPDDAADAVELGRRYFTEVSRDGGPVCSRCHADDGADLQYYAFSNHSIVARAMFHEFSREEADQIAAYLRSLDVPIDGRTWIPPFQPGPGNYGAAGAGLVFVDDDEFRELTFGDDLSDAPWDWAAAIDTFTLPTSVELPTWFRWLPRELDDEWFERRDAALATTEAALAADPSLENAHAFMSAAVQIGKDVMVESGDHQARIDLLRFAAVKLWDWSRRHGFYGDDHGFPDDEYADQGFRGSPAYPYEVGFAFFEAEPAGLRDAFEQTTQWWWLQIAVDPGRGRSNGSRPLNYRDVLHAAEFEVGPNQLAFLHLLGSWEESRGPLEDAFGTDVGPVRLLRVPLLHLPAADQIALWTRFFARLHAHLDAAGTMSAEFRTELAGTWTATCDDLTPAQRATIRATSPQEAVDLLAACP